MVGIKVYLQDQLVSFSDLTLLVVIWPLKIVPDMTYNVFGGTLNFAQSINPNSHGSVIMSAYKEHGFRNSSVHRTKLRLTQSLLTT